MNTHWPRSMLPALVLSCAAIACRSDGNPANVASGPTAQATSPMGAKDAPPAPASVPAASAGLAPIADGAVKAELGQLAPDFVLKDMDGREHKLSSYRGKLVVLEWFNPTCPYCEYAYGSGPLAEMPERCREKGIVWLSVNSEAGDHPGGVLERNRTFVEKHALKAPLVLDSTGAVGRSYGAKSTPHVFVVNEKGVLVYRGALDNAPMGKVDGSGPKVNYVDAAIADLQSGHAVARNETTSYG